MFSCNKCSTGKDIVLLAIAFIEGVFDVVDHAGTRAVVDSRRRYLLQYGWVAQDIDYRMTWWRYA